MNDSVANIMGRWNLKYKNFKEQDFYKKSKCKFFTYGDLTSYIEAANFLSSCSKVEDWGSGLGGFKLYRPDAIGIDGSDGELDRKADLRYYTSKVEGVHLRHVLEHNWEWQKITRNALSSATKKIVITFFIPLLKDEETKIIMVGRGENRGIPDIAISEKEFLEIIDEFKYKIENIERKFIYSDTQYGCEEVFFIKFLT